MPVKSTPFGPVVITGEDAKAFEKALNEVVSDARVGLADGTYKRIEPAEWAQILSEKIRSRNAISGSFNRAVKTFEDAADSASSMAESLREDGTLMHVIRETNESISEIEMKHYWVYCSHCEAESVVCGTCGNNCCNGSYGEVVGPKHNTTMGCPDCKSAYEMQGSGKK